MKKILLILAILTCSVEAAYFPPGINLCFDTNCLGNGKDVITLHAYGSAGGKYSNFFNMSGQTEYMPSSGKKYVAYQVFLHGETANGQVTMGYGSEAIGQNHADAPTGWATLTNASGYTFLITTANVTYEWATKLIFPAGYYPSSTSSNARYHIIMYGFEE